MPPVRWDDVRYLEALVRDGSAAAAARELGVSPSTVYRRIEALESELGAPCLVRGTGEVSLTAVGHGLVQLAADMSAGLARVGQLAQKRTREVRGEVSLTTVEGFVPLLVAPLAALSASHPELSVTLHLGDSGPSVRRREVDVAIGVMPRPPRGLVGRRVLTIRFGVFGTASAAGARPRRWVVAGPPMEHAPEADWERRHASSIAVATGSRHAMVELLKRGVGVGLLPSPIAALHPELEELAEYREAASEVQREAWILVHPEMRDDARVRALVDALLESIGHR